MSASAGCDLDVSNPQVIDANRFDPTEDAATLALSAQTNLYNAFGEAVVSGAYFSGEAWVGAVRQETNDFGRRVITSANLDINPQLWAPISLAVASNEEVIEALEVAPDAASNVHIARAAMNSGFALTLMAEHFCQGVMLVGPLMSVEETLDSAIVRFERAIGVGGALIEAAGDAASQADAAHVVNAARVGAARAYLQKREYTSAIAAAADVPADFVHQAIHVDDPGNRGRAGNPVFALRSFQTFVVPAAYRALNDPRVPSQDLAAKAQDGQLDLVVQTKYTDYGAPIRIASGLEARYIRAESELIQGHPAAAEKLIAERRAANGQPPYTDSGEAALLAELMDQRARDFWLEGKHLGDYRRNPGATPYFPPAGSPFYKPSQGDFGDLTCVPIPNEERDTNPNL